LTASASPYCQFAAITGASALAWLVVNVVWPAAGGANPAVALTRFCIYWYVTSQVSADLKLPVVALLRGRETK